MGPGRVLGGYRVVPLPDHPSSPPPRVHPPHRHPTLATRRAAAAGLNSAVGLRSVAQLTLVGHFSGSRGMTEVYNLVVAGNANDHNVIPGNK